jgi:branched-subunit amino acid ABC-type transport system permease component
VVGVYAVTCLDGVVFGLLLFTVAAGLMLSFGIVHALNLAHGSLYLAGAYLAAWLSDGGWTGFLLALTAGVLAGLGGGTILALLLNPLTGRPLEQSLATLGVAYLAAEGFVALFGAAPLPTGPPRLLDGSLHLVGHHYPTYRLVFLGITVVLAGGLHWLMRHSTAGLMLRAVVADPGMAAATGLDPSRIHTLALACGGLLAVTAGVLGAPLVGPAPGVDTTILLLSLIIVVLGGAGSIPATLAASLLVGQVQTLGAITAPALAPFALLLVLLIVLVARSGPTVTARTAT